MIKKDRFFLTWFSALGLTVGLEIFTLYTLGDFGMVYSSYTDNKYIIVYTIWYLIVPLTVLILINYLLQQIRPWKPNGNQRKEVFKGVGLVLIGHMVLMVPIFTTIFLFYASLFPLAQFVYVVPMVIITILKRRGKITQGILMSASITVLVSFIFFPFACSHIWR